MRIDAFSDTICPWCFLGKRRFELALSARPQYEPRVAWRPFELNPDLPPEGIDRAAYFANRSGDKMPLQQTESILTEQGAEIGLRFRFDLITRVPNTRRSHLLIAHAARQGRQSEVMDRIMRAYFEELVRLAVETGLTEHSVRSALVLREGYDGLVAAERHAALLGITAVPTFIFDGQYTLSGAQEVAALVKIIDQVAEYAAAREVAQ
jgi:predicted DsbA family dithiol-disulfide isomerase